MSQTREAYLTNWRVGFLVFFFILFTLSLTGGWVGGVITGVTGIACTFLWGE
jgi:hypothetical protein